MIELAGFRLKGAVSKIRVAAAVVLAAVAMPRDASAQTGSWANDTDTAWVFGSDVSVITTAAEFARFADVVNSGDDDFEGKTVVLANAVDLSAHFWQPVGVLSDPFGNPDAPFRGTFDGGGHAISGLHVDTTELSSHTSETGLFGGVEGAVLRNITLEAPVVSGGIYIGGVVGWADRTTLSNIVSLAGAGASVAGDGDTELIGGIAGYATGTSFRHVRNEVAVFSETGTVGGIAACADGAFDAAATFADVVNAGAVTGAGVASDNLVIVHGGDPVSYAVESVGGISGSGYSILADGVRNLGTVSGRAARQTAGLFGESYDSTVRNAFNSGDVSGTTIVGGLVGKLSQTELVNAYNAGSVALSRTGWESDARRTPPALAALGGIAGQALGRFEDGWPHLAEEFSNGRIENAVNYGAVTNTTSWRRIFVGGLIGVQGDTMPLVIVAPPFGGLIQGWYPVPVYASYWKL
ncbi:MAG: hypothetical protein LBW77_02215, partial [Verrucomicrobiota bacterium]|nr:hypothetical protein [Verrucomicrobiota bacterium]